MLDLPRRDLPAFLALWTWILLGAAALLAFRFDHRVVAAVVLAPLVEEVVYRWALQDALMRQFAAVRAGLPGAVWLSSFLFGLTHLLDYSAAHSIGTGVYGLFLGWLKWKSDRLYLPIAFHGIANAAYALAALRLHA